MFAWIVFRYWSTINMVEWLRLQILVKNGHILTRKWHIRPFLHYFNLLAILKTISDWLAVWNSDFRRWIPISNIITHHNPLIHQCKPRFLLFSAHPVGNGHLGGVWLLTLIVIYFKLKSLHQMMISSILSELFLNLLFLIIDTKAFNSALILYWVTAFLYALTCIFRPVQ